MNCRIKSNVFTQIVVDPYKHIHIYTCISDFCTLVQK